MFVKQICVDALIYLLPHEKESPRLFILFVRLSEKLEKQIYLKFQFTYGCVKNADTCTLPNRLCQSFQSASR